jgi:hypothetical protein
MNNIISHIHWLANPNIEVGGACEGTVAGQVLNHHQNNSRISIAHTSFNIDYFSSKLKPSKIHY